MKKKLILAVMAATIVIMSGCSKTEATGDTSVADTQPTTNMQTVTGNAGEANTTAVNIEETKSQKPVIIAKFETEVTLKYGEEAEFEGGVTLKLDNFANIPSKNQKIDRFDYYLSDADGSYEGRIYAYDLQYFEYRSMDNYFYPVKVVTATTEGATLVIGNKEMPRAPYVLSGNHDDLYTTTDYEYVVGKRCNLYLDKNVTIRGDLANSVDVIIDKLETESGLKYLNDSKYSSWTTINARETYYNGINPWPTVDTFNFKPGMLLANDSEGKGLVSCSLNKTSVIITDDYKINSNDMYVFAHEAAHGLCDSNIGGNSRRFAEGFAHYWGYKICNELGYTEGYYMQPGSYRYNDVTVTRENAENIYLTATYSDPHDDRIYSYGYAIMTYIYETYGNDAIPRVLIEMNDIMEEEGLWVGDEQVEAKAFKKVLSPTFFEDFADWFNINQSRL